jgi:hypothetical protein
MFCVHVSNYRFQPVHVNSKKVQFRIIDVFCWTLQTRTDSTDSHVCSVVYKNSASLHVKLYMFDIAVSISL